MVYIAEGEGWRSGQPGPLRERIWKDHEKGRMRMGSVDGVVGNAEVPRGARKMRRLGLRSFMMGIGV